METAQPQYALRVPANIGHKALHAAAAHALRKKGLLPVLHIY